MWRKEKYKKRENGKKKFKLINYVYMFLLTHLTYFNSFI